MTNLVSIALASREAESTVCRAGTRVGVRVRVKVKVRVRVRG
jgi:hypothetical protein